MILIFLLANEMQGDAFVLRGGKSSKRLSVSWLQFIKFLDAAYSLGGLAVLIGTR